MSDRRGEEEIDGYERQVGLRLRQAGLVNPPTVVERCSCGGDIRLTRRAHDELVSAVSTHQESPRHAAWRRKEGL